MNRCDGGAVFLQYRRGELPFGPGSRKLRFWWKRLCWRWFVSRHSVAKRLLDIVGSLIGIAVLSPLMLLIVLLILLEDGRPAIFVQKRVGKFGREFNFYKFRSMCRDADRRLHELLARNQHAEGVTFKMKDDPRVTRVGRWLRKFSFDELPQLFNVLRGDMSLVGPRPPLPHEVALYSQQHRRRLAVEGGITCYWQIGGRSDIQFSRQVQLDLQYIEEQSLRRDLWILWKTVPAVLAGKGAC